MYDYIKGKIVSKQINSYRGTHIVVESNNTGYLILTNARTISKIKDGEEEIKVYVSLNHKEDSMTLTGFLTKEERDIFNILQSVSGIGIKLAMLILNEFEISEIIDIMIKQDYKELSRAKGVGAKVAQKIIIELKDKLINWANVTPENIIEVKNEKINQDTLIEVQSVLISLGYSQEEIKNAFKEVMSYNKDINKVEDILKSSLTYLSKL